jgi:hypothetical protein
MKNEKTDVIDTGEMRTTDKTTRRRGRPPGKLAATAKPQIIRRPGLNNNRDVALEFYREITRRFIRDIDPDFLVTSK